MKKCLNCGADFSDNYCSRCGQKEIAGKPTLQSIFADFLQVVFKIESSAVNTIKALIIKPGIFVRSYLNGKRQSFIGPLEFFLLFLTIYLIILNWAGDEIFEFMNQSLATETPDKVKNIGMDVKQVQVYIRKNLDLFYFFMPPIVAFFLRLFFRKAQINYAESLIFSFYLIGIGFLFSFLIMLFSLIDIRFMILRVLILFGFFPFAIVQFSNSRKTIGYLKSVIAVSLSYLVYMIIVGGITVVYFAIIYQLKSN